MLLDLIALVVVVIYTGIEYAICTLTDRLRRGKRRPHSRHKADPCTREQRRLDNV